MCKEAMKLDIFRKIVKTVSHKGMFKFFKDGKISCKPIIWNNTNRLLAKKEVFGIKTGITGRAGGCLATIFNIDKETEVYVIVLGSLCTESRFSDTLRLMNRASDENLAYTS
jgi:D-alanyl-D-alanine carboxypeptidase